MKSKLLVILFMLVTSLGMAQDPHYWDGIEHFDGPTDVNPTFASLIDFYFDRMLPPIPDTITAEIDRLVERASYNPDLRDFILWHLIEKYRHPIYMIHEDIFVYLYDNYFSQLEIKDLNEVNLAMIRDKAEHLRRLALFELAPNIKIGDFDLQSLQSKYTILLFHDHDCPLCQEEMRELDSIVNLYPGVTLVSFDINPVDSKGFEIHAKGNGNLEYPLQNQPITNPSALVDLYDIETTPLIYVLDSERSIIAKKIQAKQIPLVL